MKRKITRKKYTYFYRISINVTQLPGIKGFNGFFKMNYTISNSKLKEILEEIRIRVNKDFNLDSNSEIKLKDLHLESLNLV